jgi:hypothetical protein
MMIDYAYAYDMQVLIASLTLRVLQVRQAGMHHNPAALED